MNVRVFCPLCDSSARVELPQSPDREGGGIWTCPGCEHILTLAPGRKGPALPCCAVCEAELYKKKDFPHTLGMGILVAAILTSTITYWLYDKWLTWAILIGSAIVDGGLYLLVKDVVVCYRCHAEHRGVPVGSEHPTFELTIHERYRQEKLRKEQLLKREAEIS